MHLRLLDSRSKNGVASLARSRSKNGVASLARSRSKNGVASLARSRSKNGVASLAYGLVIAARTLPSLPPGVAQRSRVAGRGRGWGAPLARRQ